jgi:hypothetical protein
MQGVIHPMPIKMIDDIRVVYDPDEIETAGLISDSVAHAIPLIRASWGLSAPENCRIYIMTSWRGFFFQSAPWAWKILLVVIFPLWASRAWRTWPYSAAWTQAYGRHVAIGIKPPRLLELSDKSIGALIFTEVKDASLKIRHLTCHELTHACSAHLRLPAWLNEGLATVTVDRLLGQGTFRPDTLGLLRSQKLDRAPLTYRQLSRSDKQAIAYHSVLGYWLVRYLEDVHPGFITQLLASKPRPRMFDAAIARELSLDPAEFWQAVPGLLVSHFEKILSVDLV